MATEPIERPPFWSRETRLLLLTVALSVAVLFALARFRFPGQEPLELPAQPLQRLAARAAFEDLSAAVSRAAERLRPALQVVRVPTSVGAARSLSLEDVLWNEPESVAPRLALAFRFSEDATLVVAHPRGWPPGAPGVRARDEVRGLLVLDASDSATDGWQPPNVSSLSSIQYLLLAEATQGGVALRPLFGGTADPFADPFWDEPVLALGQDTRAMNGSLVFTLEGAFGGAVMERQGLHAIVPASVLIRTAERLMSSGDRPAATMGVRLQHLSATLRAATGASTGVVVADVDPQGPAANVLSPGDVLTRVAGQRVDAPDTALLAIARLPIDRAASLDLRRNGEPSQVTITPRRRQEEETTSAAVRAELGLVLRRVPTGALVQSVAARTAGAVAGLREDDVITWVDGTDSPTPQRIVTLWTGLEARQSMMLRIDRAGEPMIMAVGKP